MSCVSTPWRCWHLGAPDACSLSSSVVPVKPTLANQLHRGRAAIAGVDLGIFLSFPAPVHGPLRRLGRNCLPGFLLFGVPMQPLLTLTLISCCCEEPAWRADHDRGGGVSTCYPHPSWQKEAVPANGYNAMGRAFPGGCCSICWSPVSGAPRSVASLWTWRAPAARPPPPLFAAMDE